MRKFVLAATACVAVCQAYATVSVVARQDDEPTVAPAPLECNDIVNLMIGKLDFTDVTKTVCKAWGSYLEPAFGPFPVDSVEGINDMLQTVTGPGGLWATLEGKYQEKNDDYCIRKETQRVEMVSARKTYTKICPPIISSEILDEMPAIVNEAPGAPTVLNTGYWSCAEDKDVPDECQCTRRDVKNQAVERIPTQPMGCKMVHSGKCYGDCPYGYRPTFLKGWFRPVCTSVCVSTNHRVTCGVGCANSRRSCAGVILQQAKAIIITASKVVGFLTAGTAGLVLAQTVEQVVKLAEFAFDILSTVLQVLDVAFTMFKREQAELALLLSIFQVIKEAAGDLAGDVGKFMGLVDKTSVLFFELIDSKFQWVNLDLGWITGTLIAHGADILGSAFQVAEAFTFKPCEIANDDVSHTIEDVGDTRVVGPWTKDGAVNGKGAYRNLANREAVIAEWSSRSKSWSIWVMDRTYGRGWWFGWLGFGWREMYESFSDVTELPQSGWVRVEGALPLPFVVPACMSSPGADKEQCV